MLNFNLPENQQDSQNFRFSPSFWFLLQR